MQWYIQAVLEQSRLPIKKFGKEGHLIKSGDIPMKSSVVSQFKIVQFSEQLET